jgi:lysyl-tRNA synthetase class 2
LFETHLNLNPHTATIATLKDLAEKLNIHLSPAALQNLKRDDWLDILMTHHLEPTLGFTAPVMIYDYPETQAALAKLRQDLPNEPPVGERFEVYIQGIELANGYHELRDSTVQGIRFQEDCARRADLGAQQMVIDHRLIQAIDSGLPACAGVALGVDRLFMLKMGCKSIRDVLAFPAECA